MIISLIGPDGAGKSTHVKYLKEYFKKLDFETEIVYPFNYFILRKVLNIFKNNKPSKKTKQNLKINNISLFKLWPIISLFDNYLHYLLGIKLKSSQKIIITDRYFYDLATAFKEFGYTTNYLYKIYLKAIPKPDICIILNGNPQTLKSREHKDKHSIDFFERQHKRYKQISKYLKIPSVNIDKSMRACRKEILRIIYEKATI